MSAVEEPSATGAQKATGARGNEGGAAQAELDRLRAERDALAAKLDRRAERKARGGRIRRAVVLVMVALTIVLIPLTATVTWAHQTLFNTTRWEQTVGPLGSDPAIINAASNRLVNSIYTEVDPEQKITEALTALQQQVPKLPSAVTALAGPIADGMKGFLTTQVNKVLSSPQFQTFWVNATSKVQQQVVAILKGESTTIQTVNGMVVLNLVPVLNQVLLNIQGTLNSLLGKNITLPTISGNELPSVACDKIATALNVPPEKRSPTCGQIPLFPASKLDAAQQAVGRFNRLFVGLLIVTPLLAIGAIWLSRRHRRTALQIAVGGVLGLVVIRRLTMYLQGRLEGAAQDKAAAHALISQVLHLFFDLTLALGIIGLVVVAALLLTGPYRWARALRSWVARAAVAVGRFTVAVTRSLAGHTRDAAGRARDEATLDWIRRHKGALQIGGVAVAVILLWLVDLSPLALLIIGLLLAGYLFGLARVAPHHEPPDEGAPPPGAISEPVPAELPPPRPG